MNFLLLCIQSSVCTLCVVVAKSAGLMTYREFNMDDAKKWFPISSLLVAVIYTGSKSLVRLHRTRFLASDLTLLPAIPEHPGVHDLQEPDYYSYRESVKLCPALT